MCKKIVSEGSARNVDPCLEAELEKIKNTFPRFQSKFRMIMSCCGHDRYSKTLVVQNRVSKAYFEWYSRTRLDGTERDDSRAPFYKRDKAGHYYIPEVDEEILILYCPYCEKKWNWNQVKIEIINEVEPVCPNCHFYLKDYE